MADVAPSQTLYLNNLNDKIRKKKLRRQLFNICSKFGAILDIAVQPGASMRGQAWVVFSNVESATNAKSKLNGYKFFDKPIQAQFARENSDIIAKLEGRPVAPRPPKRKAEPATNGEQPAKRGRVDQEQVAETVASAAQGGGSDSNNPPGPLLKLDNLPEEVTKEKLEELFSKYDGFHKNIRHVPGKGVAFVEYDTTEQAKLAREGLKGHQITPTHRLRINFAKPRD